MFEIAKTPEPLYCAVIFTTIKSSDLEGYQETSERILKLAEQEKGFLGIESARGELNLSVTYWESLEDISRWKNHAAHLAAQQKGLEVWYKAFATRVCKVGGDRFFER
jgi:heme-degrading monooxygenase HmoA